jgi:2-amino-4-hydroxy-6-hydroxymethyldihydropteridine diphosphokinase
MSITAYIALGSNLGERSKNLARAIELLRAAPGVQVTRISSYFDNPAVGGPADAPRFLNAACEVRTTLSPQELLQMLLQIESDMGRVRVNQNESRVIDLDVLLYGDRVIATPELTVPHPRMHERDFVLKPMEEIAYDLSHPVLKRTMHELLEGLYR